MRFHEFRHRFKLFLAQSKSQLDYTFGLKMREFQFSVSLRTTYNMSSTAVNPIPVESGIKCQSHSLLKLLKHA